MSAARGLGLKNTVVSPAIPLDLPATEHAPDCGDLSPPSPRGLVPTAPLRKHAAVESTAHTSFAIRGSSSRAEVPGDQSPQSGSHNKPRHTRCHDARLPPRPRRLWDGRDSVGRGSVGRRAGQKPELAYRADLTIPPSVYSSYSIPTSLDSHLSRGDPPARYDPKKRGA